MTRFAVVTLTLSILAGTTVQAATVIRLQLNAIDGGKNAPLAQWIKEIEPLVESNLRAQGKDVDLQFVQNGAKDEDYKAQLILDVRGGTGADIYGFDGMWVPEFASANLLEPLDRYVNAWSEWDQYYKSVQNGGSYKGRVYAVPTHTDVRGIYYRKDLFKRAGLPENWAPKTVADIYRAGEALKKLEGVTPIQWNAGRSYGEATTLQGFWMALLSAGGRLYNWESDKWVVGGSEMRQALNFYKQLYVDRKLANVNLQLDAKGRDRSFELFRDGKIGMYAESTFIWLGVLKPGATWGMNNRDTVVGWAPVPTARGGDDQIVSISGVAGMILNKNSKNKDLAWDVLRTVLSENSMNVRMKVATFVPPRRDLLGNASFRADTELRQQVQTALPVTVFRPGFPVYPRISELVQQMTESVIQGVPVDRALATFSAAVSALVGKDNTTTRPN